MGGRHGAGRHPGSADRQGRHNVPVRTDLLSGPRPASQAASVARCRIEPCGGASLMTVEWHLGNVFTKLGISSRRELRRALAHLGQADLPA